MDKLVTAQPSSKKSFLDKHRSEYIIAIRAATGVYMLWIAVALLAPWMVQGLASGGGSLYVWGLFCFFLTVFCTLAGVKLLVTSTLQLMILRSLKSMQFARTKSLCLRSMKLLKNWPLVHSAELSYFEIGLGAVCVSKADYSEAEMLFASAVSRYRVLINKYKHYRTRYYPNMVVTLCHLSRAYTLGEKYEEAERAAAEALEFARSIGKIKYRRLEIFPLHALALCHLRSAALDQAESEYNLVFKMYSETQPLPGYGSTTFAPIMMSSKLGLAIVAVKRGNSQAAYQFWKEYLTLEAQYSLPGSPSFLRAYNMLASGLMESEMPVQAEEVLEIAYSVAKHYFDHPDAQETLSNYEKLLLSTDRQGEVKDMRAWLRLTATKPVEVRSKG